MAENWKLDWNSFEKNEDDFSKKFEALARRLFIREFPQERGLPTLDNQPFLETCPVLTEKGWVSFQAKFFASHVNIDDRMGVLKNTIVGACEKYHPLDLIYFYINKDFTSGKKDVMPQKVTELENIAKKNNIDITWITKSEIEDMLRKPENTDLRNVFFPDKNMEVIQNIWLSSIERYKERNKNYPYDEKLLCKIKVGQDYLDLNQVLETERYIWLYGDGGNGKTSQVIHSWGKWVQNNSKSLYDVQTIPVYIPLQWFNNVTQVGSELVLFYYLQQEYLEGITDISPDDVKKIILGCKSIEFIFFLDGFNELPFQTESGGSEIPKVIIDAISKLERRDNVRYVITSRNKYEKNKDRLILKVKDFKIEPLPDDRISEYLGDDNWKETAISDLLHNPMMLSIFKEVKKAGDDGEQIREKKDLLKKYYDMVAKSIGDDTNYKQLLILPFDN